VSVEALRSVPAFAGLSDEALGRLADAATECEFPAGHVLIEANTPAAGLFVVLDGRVRVHAREGDSELGPGAVVGERALLRGGTRTARVAAITPVRCLSIARDALDREIAETQ
jgi:CRP-like cAMP-binding protein